MVKKPIKLDAIKTKKEEKTLNIMNDVIKQRGGSWKIEVQETTLMTIVQVV